MAPPHNPVPAWPTPSWSSSDSQPVTKKTQAETQKGGSRSRSHPAERAGGEEAILAMAAPKSRRRFLLGLVGGEALAPSRGGPLQAKPGSTGGQTRRENHGRHRRTASRRSRSRQRRPNLTDEQWALVSPLLPPQRGEVGRAPHDHREVLGGILWVARTGSSWREMPEQFGKWERAYRRYELWLRQGLWERILEALGEGALPGPVTEER